MRSSIILDPLVFFFFFSCPPSFVWASLIIENFLFCLSVLFGHFQSARFFFFFVSLSHLPPSVGCDPSQGYYQKNITRLKRGLQRIYFNLVKGLSKMAFLHLKCIHLGAVSLAFMWVCKVIIHSNKTQLWSHLMVFFCFSFSFSFCLFFKFSRCIVIFLKNHLNFQNSFVLDKHQYYFCFLY
jgi:hypothetical protein